LHFSLAHLSDVHLGPLPAAWAFRNFKLKRLIGAANWARKRHNLHSLDIAAAAVDSIHAARANHIAFTGDLLNISAWEEFTRGREWMEKLGDPTDLSFVPGNHDAYVKVPIEEGLIRFAPWMMADGVKDGTLQFPYVRLRRNVALIGLTTALPQALHKAGGTLGEHQLHNLPQVLESLQSQGFYRVVMIHHPPLPGLASPRKALTDAAELLAILKDKGCELVLHGHNHRTMENWFETRSGPAVAIGVPSASGAPYSHYEAAGWNLFRIRRQHGRWQATIIRHHWNAASSRFVGEKPALLSPP
jgi:3',5'-cyclic AMP phosphodiesterase CpdA